MTSRERVRISWLRNTDTRYPYGPVSPDPGYLEPIGFPPTWPSRPWIYANVITSKNGIVAWKRAGAHDDPVRTIAGGDVSRSGRLADLQLMRYLRACADAFSVGAQTLRDQPDLIGTPDDTGGGLGEALRGFRLRQGRPRFLLQVVYSESGRLDLDVPMFNTQGLTAIIVTTDAGAISCGCTAVRGRGSGSSARVRSKSMRSASLKHTRGCVRNSMSGTWSAKAGRECSRLSTEPASWMRSS